MDRPIDQSRPWASWVTALVALAAVASACSLALRIDDECTRDSDCASRGSGLRCVENLCVEGADGDGDADADADVDVDADVDADADFDADADAEDAGPLYPEDLLGPGCDEVVGVPSGEPLDDDTIVLGAIHPMTGELELVGPYFKHATVLAVEEINGVGGLLGPKLALVLCDEGDGGATAVASARHLADIGVQAVLGPFTSTDVLEVFDDVFRDEGIAIVTAGANSPVMDPASTEGLIWSTSLPAGRQATAIAEHLLAQGYAKVAVVNRNDPWGTGMRDELQDVLCDRFVCVDSGRYRNAPYRTDANMSADLAGVVSSLTEFDPDVTVMLTYVTDALTFLGAVAAAGAPLRSFVWNDALGDDIVFDNLPVPAQPLLCQVMGTTAALPTGQVYRDFLLRYNTRWSEEPVPYTANYYDATYLLAYAIAAATRDSAEFTGADVGLAMARLSRGEDIDAGAGDFRHGIQILRTSSVATIDYVGASGDVDFVEGTGSIVAPVQAYRLNVGRQELESLGVIFDESGAYAAPDYSGVTDTACELVEP
jgi:branched-chain amino acid transport system substrate-binding protein